MTSNPANDWLDQQLATGLGSAPPANFDQWKAVHRDACLQLNPLVSQRQRQWRRLQIRVLQVAAAVICLLGGSWWLTTSGTVERAAFAESLQKTSVAKAMQWKETFYSRVTSEDGKRTWLKAETRDCAYLEPGVYREIRYQSDGKIHSIYIADAVNQKELRLFPQKETAMLISMAFGQYDVRGPFAWISKEVQKLGAQQLGRSLIGEREADGFRLTWNYDSGPFSNDFWLDVKSKRIVKLLKPGSNLFDPQTDLDRDKKAETEWSSDESLGVVYHDIVYDAKLDRSLFSLDIPEGYTGNTIGRPTVTEAEMIEFLGAVAAFNANVFPDDSRGLGVTSAEFNKASEKPKDERTAAEQKLIDLHHKYVVANLNFMPVRHFIDDHTAPNTFQHLGKGVPLGEAGRIVCWYKLKGTGKYRAVYADLKVQDIDPKDLPLPVEP